MIYFCLSDWITAVLHIKLFRCGINQLFCLTGWIQISFPHSDSWTNWSTFFKLENWLVFIQLRQKQLVHIWRVDPQLRVWSRFIISVKRKVLLYISTFLYRFVKQHRFCTELPAWRNCPDKNFEVTGSITWKQVGSEVSSHSAAASVNWCVDIHKRLGVWIQFRDYQMCLHGNDLLF